MGRVFSFILLIFSSFFSFINCMMSTAWAHASNRMEDAKTLQMLSLQELSRKMGFSTTSEMQSEMTLGQNQAKTMMGVMKTREIQGEYSALRESGAAFLRNNPGLQVPVAIVGVSAAIMTGQRVAITRSEQFRLVSTLDAPMRSGMLEVGSGPTDGRIQYDELSGLNLDLIQKVSEIKTGAEILYNVKTRGVGTRLTYDVTQNLAISAGVSENVIGPLDESARISFSMVF